MGGGVAGMTSLKQPPDPLLRHPRTKGYGVEAEISPSIFGWREDQAGLGPLSAAAVAGNASTDDDDEATPAIPLEVVKEALTRRGAVATTAEVDWLTFDFEAPPEPPRYIVGGLFERGTVNIVSSDTGAGKTWLSCSLIAAALAKAEWLGREVEAHRVIAVDEENPAAVIRARLRALGVTNEQVDALRYASRQGVSLGDPDWNGWLLAQAVEHSADLILVDTAMAATNIEDVNNNSEAVAIYKGLRAIAEEADLAVVLFHHHRKSQAGQPRGGGQAMMGGRQWAGQADAHITLSKKSEDGTEPDLGDGHAAFNVELRVEKLRNGIEPPPEELQITTQNEDGCLLVATVGSLGAVKREPSKAEALAVRMRDGLVEVGPTKIGALAELLGEDKHSGTWEKARKHGLDSGQIVKVDGVSGVYEAGNQEPEI